MGRYWMRVEVSRIAAAINNGFSTERGVTLHITHYTTHLISTTLQFSKHVGQVCQLRLL